MLSVSLTVGVLVWSALSLPASLILGRFIHAGQRRQARQEGTTQ